MEIIARGDPSAKLDETGEVIELRIPTGNRESLIVDLTPNQCLLLQQRLQRAGIDFFNARRAAQNWRAENVIDFAAAKRARA